MFCKNCGKELADSAFMCPNCGTPTQVTSKENSNAKSVDMNTFAIVGFIISFLSSSIGLVLSIFGLLHAKKYFGGKGKGFAIAGIVISCVLIGLSLIINIINAIDYGFSWFLRDMLF